MARARLIREGLFRSGIIDRSNKDVFIFDLITLFYVSADALRESKVETSYSILTYEPLLRLNDVFQLDEGLHCWAATNVGSGCHIFEVDAFFHV